MLDTWFGEGSAFKVWQTARARSGVRDQEGSLSGVGYTDEHDRISVEWTAGAILAAREVAKFYSGIHQDRAREAFEDAHNMRAGIESLRKDLAQGLSAYAYSSRRGWIPFGWYSHEPCVLSLASTGWVVFVDAGFNPFYLN